MGKTFDASVAGLTEYSYYINNPVILDYDGGIKTIYQMDSATIYILSDGYGNEVQKNIVVHELGHALGFFDHSSNSSDVMYAYCHSDFTLTQRDINHLKLFYNCFR